jgi:hypothetical protein
VVQDGPPFAGLIVIDGDFQDWADTRLVDVAPEPAGNPNVDIVRVAVVDNIRYLSFLVEVRGTMLAGAPSPDLTMDAVFVFIDTDRSFATGYAVNGIGADRLIAIGGRGGVANVTAFLEFDANRAADDWNGWIKAATVRAAASGSQLETQIDWLALAPSKRPMDIFVAARSWDGDFDAADVNVGTAGGELVVVQQSLVPTILSGPNQPLLGIRLAARGAPVDYEGLRIRLLGTYDPSSVTAVRLVDGDGAVLAERVPLASEVAFAFPSRSLGPGTSEELFVVADASGTDGRTLGAAVERSDAVASPNATVTVTRSPSVRAVGYLGAIPADPRVDGGFAEWGGVSTDPVGEPTVGPDSRLDLLAYGLRLQSSTAFVYFRLDGPAFNGTVAPQANDRAPTSGVVSEPDSDRDTVPDAVDPYPDDFDNDGVPDSQTGGDYDGDGVTDYGIPGGTDVWLETTIPPTFPSAYANRTIRLYIGPVTRPPLLGEDWARVFLDADNSSATGYAVGGLGADYLIEVRGRHGRILTANVSSFAGADPGAWAWTPVGDAVTAKGYAEVELAAPGLGLDPSAQIHLETGDWDLHGDASDIPATGRAPPSAKLAPAFQKQLASTSLLTVGSGTGGADGDKYGFNVSYAGRIDETAGGVDDVIVGAPYVDFGGAADRGAIYLFLGATDMSNLNAANADVVIYGEAAGDHFGWSVSDAGDVDGDGYGDILVGAPDAGAGKVYLLYGRAPSNWATASGNAVASVANVVTIVGQTSGDFFGGSVTGVGDLDGSGNADFAVGAYRYGGDRGRTYVFLGDGSIPTKASQADVKLDGAAVGDKFGFSVSDAGDVDGDATPDLIIGAPGADKAYVLTVAEMPIANPYFTADATSWSYTEVDPRGYETGGWDGAGSADAESSGAGRFALTHAEADTTNTVYFHQEQITANGVTRYRLSPSAADGATNLTIANASTSAQRYLQAVWHTGPLGVTSLKTGTWTFYYWVSVDAGVTARMEVHVFKRDSNGAETLIDGTSGEGAAGVAQTGDITATTATEFSGTWTIGSDISLAPTDSLVIRMYLNVTVHPGGNAGGTSYWDAANRDARIVSSTISFPSLRYFHSETATVNTATTVTLAGTAPDQGTAQTVTVKKAQPGHYFLEEWTTEQLGVAGTVSGYLYFTYWAYATGAQTPTVHLDVHVYKRSASGTLTAIDGTDGQNATDGVAPSATLTSTLAAYVGEFSLPSTTLAETDALVVRIYADITATIGQATVVFEFDEAAKDSRVALPFTVSDKMILTQSASFTTPSTAPTETKWTLGWSSAVSSLGSATYGVKLQVRDAGDTDTVATLYDSGTQTAAQSFSLQSGTTAALSPSTSYRLRVLVTVDNFNVKDTPSITVYVDDITLTFRTHGELAGTASTNFGWSVSTAGNVDDDATGYADVVVGAPDTANGAAYVYFGGAPFDTAVDVTITGEASGDRFGFSVSNAGDIGGDGIDDIVVGAPYWDSGAAADVGHVYVFAGSASLASTLGTVDAAYEAAGEGANDHFGWSVSDAGYPDGTSNAAIVVGAPDFDAGGSTFPGKVYILNIPEFREVVVPVLAILVAFVVTRRRRHGRNG